MLTPGLAVPVTANPGVVAYPSSGPSQQWTAVELANASPYVLKVYVGGQFAKQIQAWNVDVLPLLAGPTSVAVPGQPITFQPVAPAGGAPTGGDSTLYPTFAMAGDLFTAVYPYSLTAQAITSAISSLNTQQEVGHFTVNAGTSTGPTLLAIPSNTVGIGVFVSTTITGYQTTDELLVSGSVSGVGVLHVGGNPPAPTGTPAMTQGFYQGIVDPAVDTGVNVTYTNNGAHAVTVRVVAYSQLPFAQNAQLLRTGAFVSSTGVCDQPVIVSDGGNTPFTDFTVNAATGTSQHVLAAPTGGFVWEIASRHIHAPTAAAGVVLCYLQSVAGAAVQLVAYSGANGTSADSDALFKFRDGLDLHNTTAVTATATVVARLIPDIP